MATYRVKLTAKEAGRMEAAAELDGLTPADWLRNAIATRANGSINRARQRGDEAPVPATKAASLEVEAERGNAKPPKASLEAMRAANAAEGSPLPIPKPKVAVRVKRRRRPLAN